ACGGEARLLGSTAAHGGAKTGMASTGIRRRAASSTSRSVPAKSGLRPARCCWTDHGKSVSTDSTPARAISPNSWRTFVWRASISPPALTPKNPGGTSPTASTAVVAHRTRGRMYRPRRLLLAMVDSVRGQLLIAAPSLLDPNFQRTVVLIAEHTDEGAL